MALEGTQGLRMDDCSQRRANSNGFPGRVSRLFRYDRLLVGWLRVRMISRFLRVAARPVNRGRSRFRSNRSPLAISSSGIVILTESLAGSNQTGAAAIRPNSAAAPMV